MKTLRTAALTLAMALLASPAAWAEVATFQIDPDHSTVGFKVRHMMSFTTGQFRNFQGGILMDAATGKVSGAKVVIDAASVDTNHEKRDKHLRDTDFFNVEKFPTLTFTAKDFKQSGNNLAVAGELTMLGETRPVTLQGRYLGSGIDPWGNGRVGFTLISRVDRKDFGMVFNKVLDNGGLLIGEVVDIQLDIEAIKVPAEPK
ncbi:MAG: YceI family protein [Leptospirillia bacterium]